MSGGARLQQHLPDAAMTPSTRRDPIGKEERDFVRKQRRLYRSSWQDCAVMIDRSIHDTRMACDPDYGPAIIARGRIDLPTLADLPQLADHQAAVLHAAKTLFAHPSAGRVAAKLDISVGVAGGLLSWACGEGLAVCEPSAFEGEAATYRLTPRGELAFAAWRAARA